MSSPAFELGAAPHGTPRRVVLGALAAVAAHGLVLLAALQSEGAPLPPALVITEVDLSPVAPPPPPLVEPEVAKPEAAAPAAIQAPPAPRAPRRAAAPAPAAAGALHLAKEEAPSSSEPVRFAVDANGAGFGFGVVAAGGTGQGRGAAGTPSPAPAAPSAPSAGTASLRSFAVPPRLDEADPCRGFFPTAASVDRGTVTLKLLVSSQGRVERASVLAEQPPGQGFGRSAVQCLRQKRFLPAQDERGLPQASEAPVAVRFSR